MTTAFKTPAYRIIQKVALHQISPMADANYNVLRPERFELSRCTNDLHSIISVDAHFKTRRKSAPQVLPACLGSPAASGGLVEKSFARGSN
jgi:hypothetical protein